MVHLFVANCKGSNEEGAQDPTPPPPPIGYASDYSAVTANYVQFKCTGSPGEYSNSISSLLGYYICNLIPFSWV